MKIILLAIFTATALLGSFFHLEPVEAQEPQREQYMTPAVPTDTEDIAQCAAEEHRDSTSINSLPCPTDHCVMETQPPHHKVEVVQREQSVTPQQTVVSIAFESLSLENARITDGDLPPVFTPMVVLRV